MNTHEYQAKLVLEKYGVKVPQFRVVTNMDEAKNAVDDMEISKAVVKVQVHAGGRGKAGGVKLAQTRDEIFEHVKNMLGMKIVNNQTGPEGVICHQVMITDLTDIKKEYYVGAIIDRANAVASLIVSPEGGMEIEEIAETMPEKIKTVAIGNDGTLRGYQLVQIAKFMGWSGETAKKGKKMVAALAKAFIDTDASLLEINPLVETPDGDILAVDAKLSIDSNALYRQQQISAYYDPTQIPANEARAVEYGLEYIALDGDIGCMVNGAGLAMSTMDIIQHYGGKPANFLDVGGSADVEKVTEGFKIILSDPNVKAILVNIFGGIMNCATIGEAVETAVKQLGLKVPLVVRMEGTNMQQGKKILADSGLNITVADGLSDAAEKIVAARNELG
ncbi:MAG: ADP-forming succinate--CoA ligase subunit beta [Chlamydiota bacterium]|nr:ADP-forming succinate--CoA ligase subunit beta [Chlamydiota bacterium]